MGNNSPPSEASSYSPPSEGSGVVSYRLAKRSTMQFHNYTITGFLQSDCLGISF
ncbi:MAG: hypothetical protein LBC74_08565 [Planctomycetaceae bacterium]|nr:hypothetical protein [Planctomycetaceae bacterium]